MNLPRRYRYGIHRRRIYRGRVHWARGGVTIPTVGLQLVAVVTESGGIAETTVEVATLLRVIDEAGGVTETTVEVAALLRVIDESGGIAETTVEVASLLRVIDESGGIAETTVEVASLVRVVDEAGGIAETTVDITTAGGSALVAVVTESGGIAETTVEAAQIARVVSESVGITETTVDVAALLRVISEALGVAETTVEVATLLRVIDESGGIAETTLAFLGAVVVVDEAVGVTETTVDLTTLATGKYETLSNKVRTKFGTDVEDALGLPVHYGNTTSAAPASGLWIGCAVHHDETVQRSAGRTKVYEMRGRMVATIKTPLGSGDGTPRSTAATIVSAFQGQLVSSVRYGSATVTPIDRDGAWYELEVTVPWRSTFEHTQTLGQDNGVTLEPVQVGNSIRSWFGVQVATAESITTQYDNAPFTPPESGRWVRFTILEGEAQPIENRGGSIAHRHVGIARTLIFDDVAIGDANSLDCADIIADAFRSVTVDGIAFRTPSVRTIGRAGKWWQTTVDCPFSYETVSS